MALKYPEIKAEGSLFRDNLRSQTMTTGIGGTITGTPVFDTGEGVSLNGSTDYIAYDGNGLTFGNGTTDKPFSVSCWIKMDNHMGFYIISKGIFGSTGEWFIGTGGVSGKLLAYLYDVNTVDYISRNYSVALSAYEGIWTHVCMTYDGTSVSTGIKLYINGSQVDDATVETGGYTAMSNLNADVHIGEVDAGFADGKIRDLTIYNKALSVSEISDIYNNTTFSELDASKSAIYLPLISRYYDGTSVAKTTNFGTIGDVTVGDGTTTTTFPTILENNGMSFDGGDYINGGDQASLDSPTYMSISCIFSLTSVGAVQPLLCKGAVGVNGGYALYVNASGYLVWQVEQSDGTARAAISNILLVKNVKYSVAATLDKTSATGLKIFINGIESTYSAQTDPSTIGAIASSGYNFVIGAYSALGTFLTGKIWKPKVFMGSAFTPTQINWFYQRDLKELNR